MENNIETIETSSEEKSISPKKKESFWDLIKFAIIAFAIVLPIRMFIAQPFVVSGESMYPTFHDGEYLIVDEISYLTGEPKRGDVVIFRYPDEPSRFFIKRIIGLPNETIVIDHGKVMILNDDENQKTIILDEPYINEEFNTIGKYKTGDDEYFVMGDNRNRSSDSRYWGVLPKKLMIGRAFLRLLPLKEISYMPGAYESTTK